MLNGRTKRSIPSLIIHAIIAKEEEHGLYNVHNIETNVLTNDSSTGILFKTLCY